MAERRSLTFGPFRLDLLQSRLWREAQPLALRPQAFAVLRYLVLHADQLVTKAELLQQVWDGRQVTDSVLRGCIHAIRAALADTADTPQYLDTVGRQGYQFRLGRAATRLPQAAARPVVGRQGEVAWLRERWRWAREGRRQCAMLSFQHALYRQVLAERLGALQRLQVQRRMGEWLAQGYGPQTPTSATQLACHFVQGRLPPRAVPYLHQEGGYVHFLQSCQLFGRVLDEHSTDTTAPRLWGRVSRGTAPHGVAP